MTSLNLSFITLIEVASKT